MSLRHLEFLLQEAFTGIRRNAFMSLAAVSTIAVSLFLLGAVRLGVANLNHMAAALGDRFEMRVFLQVGANVETRNNAWRAISRIPGVKGCRLIPKEKALPELCQRLAGAVDVADLGGDNPLPDSFVVRVADLGLTGQIADLIQRVSGVDEVKDTRREAERWVTISRGIQVGGTAAAALLIAAAAIIVSNTIRLTVHARRVEIRIMQMVGATAACIRVPFLLEGAFQGAMGALVALGLLAAAYSYAYEEVVRAVPFLEALPPTSGLFLAQLGVLLGAGVGLGLIASYLSVRKYLRV